MILEFGLIFTGLIAVLAGIGMAGFLMWLRNRDNESSHRNHDGVTHA